MEYLAAEKYSEVRILANDRPDQIEEVVGDGSRWGIKIEVLKELKDLDVKEARKLHRPVYENDWAPEPNDVIIVDHLPGKSGLNPFEGYSHWFRAALEWAPQVAKSGRIGLKEMAPGIWVGKKANISSQARLVAPCWIGDHVRIERNAVVGPFAILEDKVVADSACEISQSWVGPDTFVGELTRVENSLAWGSHLINWKTGSHLVVPDSFLMCSLRKAPKARQPARKKLVVAVQSGLSRPWEAVLSMAQKIGG